MCSHSAVLAVVVAAALLLMYGLDLERVARGIVVLPLRQSKGVYECGIAVAEMLSLREIARESGSDRRTG
jgi:hypothetical protein